MLLWSKRTGLLVGLMGAYYIHSLVWITVVADVHNQPSSFMALPELSLHSRGGHHIQHPKPFGPPTQLYLPSTPVMTLQTTSYLGSSHPASYSDYLNCVTFQPTRFQT